MEPTVPVLVPPFRVTLQPGRMLPARWRRLKEPTSLASVVRGLIATRFCSLPRRLAWMTDQLLERALLCGIETEYRDAFGHLRTVEPEVLSRLLEVLESGEPGVERMLPRTVVLRGDDNRSVVLPVREALRLRWEIFSDTDGSIARGEGDSPVLALPHDLPTGVFRLRVTMTSPEHRTEDASLICCPRQASQGGKNAPAR